jgi:hypothetical protein
LVDGLLSMILWNQTGHTLQKARGNGSIHPPVESSTEPKKEDS